MLKRKWNLKILDPKGMMLKSMTAYGRAFVVSPLGRFSVEIQSVNRKHLEINTTLPNECLRFDADLKKWISSVVGRGQVNVKINVSFEETSLVTVLPNLALARQIQNAWYQLAENLQVKVEDEALIRVLSHVPDLFLYVEDLQAEEGYKAVLHQAVHQALQQLSSMKSGEGQALYADISLRLTILTKTLNQIAEKASRATSRYEEKLRERLEQVLGASIENEERILREICLYADRIDIAEELTRFESHLMQMQHLLDSDGQAVGKTLEFLIQELNREINTIGSKSSDVDIARLVITAKTELERIREQIQNIE